MKLKFIFLGKKNTSSYDIIMNNYLKRINSYTSSEFIFISDKKEQKIGQKVEQLLKPKDCLIVLDEKGKLFNTIDFHDFVHSKITLFNSVYFLIGGSYGVSKNIMKNAHAVISLSKMTLPHMLARLILVEQIYRVITIINNHPYHHE